MVQPTFWVGLSLKPLETPALTHTGVYFCADSNPIEFSGLTIIVSHMYLTLTMEYILPIKSNEITSHS